MRFGERYYLKYNFSASKTQRRQVHIINLLMPFLIIGFSPLSLRDFEAELFIYNYPPPPNGQTYKSLIPAGKKY